MVAEDTERLDLLRQLTAADLIVLRLRCADKSVEETARILDASERAVYKHLARIYQTLRITDRSRAVRQLKLASFCPLLQLLDPEDAVRHWPGGPEPEDQPPTVMALVLEDEHALAPTPQATLARPRPAALDHRPPPAPIIDVLPRRPFLAAFLGTLCGGLIVVGVLAAVLLRFNARASASTVPAGLAATSSVAPRVMTIIITATPPPLAPTATALPPTATQIPPTASPIPPSPTPVPPTATTAPTATPTKTPTPPPPTPTATPLPSLGFGQSWVGDGLTLTATGPVYNPCNEFGGGCIGPAFVDFAVENHTGATIDFQAEASDFVLQFSNGQQYAGRDSPAFNDFKPGEKRKFTVSFNVQWGDFQADERDSSVSDYTVIVTGFNNRLPVARWRQAITH